MKIVKVTLTRYNNLGDVLGIIDYLTSSMGAWVILILCHANGKSREPNMCTLFLHLDWQTISSVPSLGNRW